MLKFEHNLRDDLLYSYCGIITSNVRDALTGIAVKIRVRRSTQ